MVFPFPRRFSLQSLPSVRDMAMQLSRFAQSFKTCQSDCATILESTASMPLEIDIAQVGPSHILETTILLSLETPRPNLG